jgi:hypothetical protein
LVMGVGCVLRAKGVRGWVGVLVGWGKQAWGFWSIGLLTPRSLRGCAVGVLTVRWW